MTPPPIRLAFGAVFWRVFLVASLAREVLIWRKLRPWLRGSPPGKRLMMLLYITPETLFVGFAIAAGVTVLLDLLVRLLARPLARRWYFPRGTGSEHTPLGFHLEAGEAILAEVPARRRSAGGWRPGTLVMTSRVLWFFPLGWDLEPWSVPLGELRSLRTVPYRPAFGTFVRGVPDRIVVRDRDGDEASFAVADPAVVVDWFALPDVAQYLVAGPTSGPALEVQASLSEPHDG
jgi:hypothetical protein